MIRRFARLVPASYCLAALVSLGVLSTGCSGAGVDDSGQTDDELVQQSDATTAAQIAQLIANGDSATLARVSDMQSVPSTDPNIGAWSAYTLSPANSGAADEELTAPRPTEMVFISDGAAVPAIFYVNATGGQAAVVPETMDADAVRARLVGDLNANASAATTGATSPAADGSTPPPSAADSSGVQSQSINAGLHIAGNPVGELAGVALEGLLTTATRFLQQEGKELFENGFTSGKVSVHISGETTTGAQVHIEETLAEHQGGALKVHARAPRLSENVDLGPLSEYDIAILKEFAPSNTSYGREAAAAFRANSSQRAMFFQNWTLYRSLPEGVTEVVNAAGQLHAFRTTYVKTQSSGAWGGGYKTVQVSTTEEALALANAAQKLAESGSSTRFTDADVELVLGHDHGTTTEVGLSGVDHVYIGAVTAANYSFMLQILRSGKTLHVESDGVVTAFRAYLTNLLKEPGSCVDSYCDVVSLMQHVTSS